MGFETISLSIDAGLLKKIRAVKGKDTPVSRFICRKLEEALKIPQEKRTVYNK